MFSFQCNYAIFKLILVKFLLFFFSECKIAFSFFEHQKNVTNPLTLLCAAEFLRVVLKIYGFIYGFDGTISQLTRFGDLRFSNWIECVADTKNSENSFKVCGDIASPVEPLASDTKNNTQNYHFGPSGYSIVTESVNFIQSATK